MNAPNLGFSDYITTETVIQALNGAKDVAQAGAVETVKYVQTDAIVACGVTALALLLATVLLIGAVVLAVKNNDADADEPAMGLVALLLAAWLVTAVICATTLCSYAPRAINPTGAIIYDFVKGGR